MKTGLGIKQNLTDDERALFNKLRGEGWLIKQIALTYNKPYSTVQECVSGKHKKAIKKNE